MIVVDESCIKEYEKYNYVTLGTFDGLHCGHLHLINKTIEIANDNDGNSMVFTYKNHPRALVNPKNPPKLIMDLDTKLECLEKENIDIVSLRTFNEEFMKVSAEDFIKLLCTTYNVKGIIVGFNFKFGYKNLGDVNLLENLKEKYGYNLYIINPCMYRDSVVSSTKIREAILNGNIKEANKMLTKPYLMRSKVISGKRLGRTIGFPTANIVLDEKMIVPKKGVYYTNVEYDNKKFKAITSVGNNPTVNGTHLTVETFILDFDKQIYGEEIKLYFIDRIRDEKKFDSLDDLVVQIKRDKEFAINSKILI